VKPQYERVTFPSGCSLRVYHRQVPEIPFEWHHHPEYELTLTLNSRGWRFIGDHIAEYSAPDLVLVPPDMPHTWVSTSAIDPDQTHTAVVIWFSGSWAHRLADVCPEFAPLRKLLGGAVTGLSFSPACAEMVQSRVRELLDPSPRLRLRAAVEILAELADTDAAPLASYSVASRPLAKGQPAQLNRVLDLLHRRFMEPLRIEDLCAVANLSERSLHRFFIRHVGESVTDYLGRLRIGRACMMLAETDSPVAIIAAESGFSNLANFNRQFRKARHMTPTAFRCYFADHGCLPEAAGSFRLADRPPSLERRNKPSPHYLDSRLRLERDFSR
jgi:AraC-like DNA-binding protein